MLLLLHDPCNGVLAVAVQIQLDNLPDDRCGLRVDDPALLVLRVFHISVWGLSERLAGPPLCIVRRSYLAADILGIQLIHDILDGDKIVHDKLANPLLKGFLTKLVTKCYDHSRNTSSYICPQRVDIPLPCTNAEPQSSVKHSAWLAIATLYSVPKIRIS